MNDQNGKEISRLVNKKRIWGTVDGVENQQHINNDSNGGNS